MPSIAGRKCTVSVSATDGSYNVIAGIAQVSGGPAAAPIEDNEFGVEWEQNLTGILSNEVTLTGGYRNGDTNGQILIRGAMYAGTTVWLKVLFDGSTYGWKQEMCVTQFKEDTNVATKTNLTIGLKGTGAVTPI
jgi:predicted secreted protein